MQTELRAAVTEAGGYSGAQLIGRAHLDPAPNSCTMLGLSLSPSSCVGSKVCQGCLEGDREALPVYLCIYGKSRKRSILDSKSADKEPSKPRIDEATGLSEGAGGTRRQLQGSPPRNLQALEILRSPTCGRDNPSGKTVGLKSPTPVN